MNGISALIERPQSSFAPFTKGQKTIDKPGSGETNLTAYYKAETSLCQQKSIYSKLWFFQ